MRFRFGIAAFLALCAVLAATAATLVQSTAEPGASASQPSGSTSDGTRPDPVTPQAEILWDTWGVPHLFADDAASLSHAMGWAQMEGHGDLLLRLYGQARGRGAEYWGRRYLEEDRWVWATGIPARAEAWLAAQAPEFRPLLDAFVRGANDYARQHPEALDPELRVVLPLRPTDVLAHIQRSLHFSFLTSREEIADTGQRWSEKGSNAWAIAPGRSASGHAMLLANPHLPWNGLFTWLELDVKAPGVDAYGATLVGLPVMGIAFNDDLGWTHTVNTLDGADLYELTLADGGYRFDGVVVPFETEVHRLRVKEEDGSLSEERLVVRRSVHGPVVSERDGRALALRVAGLDAPNLGQQYWDMIRARDLGEFEAAVSRLQMPLFTVLYADRAGHILHVFGGRTPVRPPGDYDWGGIVPGDSRATLWTQTLPYADLPRVLDPPSGWLQNANDPPWTTTFPAALDPDRFPAYLAPRSMELRPQRSARMLDEDDHISFDELVAYKHSTRMELADRLLDELGAAVAQHGDPAARRGLAVLQAWDRCADATSRGAVLFSEFYREANRRRGKASLFAQAWDEKRPRTTPDGLRDPKLAAQALAVAAMKVQENYGALDVAWGDVYRLRRDGLDLPANGGPGSLGIFRVLWYGRDDDGRYAATGGDSYVAAIEFGSPPRAQALVGYGNASQPGSKHRTDQLRLQAEKRLRPVWRTRAEIEAHLEKREQLHISP